MTNAMPDLPSHKTSLPCGHYHIILFGDKRICVCDQYSHGLYAKVE